MSHSVSGISAQSTTQLTAKSDAVQVEVQRKIMDSQTAAMQRLIADFTGVGQIINRTA